MGELKDKVLKEIADFDPGKLNAEEKAVLEKYRSADNEEKKAALKALKSKEVPSGLKSIVSKMSGKDYDDGRSISNPLLAFTFFYSVSIYLLMISFYFWLWRTDIKPEKRK